MQGERVEGEGMKGEGERRECKVRGWRVRGQRGCKSSTCLGSHTIFALMRLYSLAVSVPYSHFHLVF